MAGLQCRTKQPPAGIHVKEKQKRSILTMVSNLAGKWNGGYNCPSPLTPLWVAADGSKVTWAVVKAIFDLRQCHYINDLATFGQNWQSVKVSKKATLWHGLIHFGNFRGPLCTPCGIVRERSGGWVILQTLISAANHKETWFCTSKAGWWILQK